jgi:hypothetical protein
VAAHPIEHRHLKASWGSRDGPTVRRPNARKERMILRDDPRLRQVPSSRRRERPPRPAGRDRSGPRSGVEKATPA